MNEKRLNKTNGNKNRKKKRNRRNTWMGKISELIFVPFFDLKRIEKHFVDGEIDRGKKKKKKKGSIHEKESERGGSWTIESR